MFFFKPIGGMYREFQGIKMIAMPKDTSIYRSLLPEQFSLPKNPSVFLFIADYFKVANWPFKTFPWALTRYQEAGVFLRSSYRGDEGWFCLEMPVSSRLSLALGRYFLGFPKYIVQEISLLKKDKNWHGYVKYRDKLSLSLAFTPGLKQNLNSWEKKILDNNAFFDDCYYLLFPAERGPRVNKVWLEEVVPPQWFPKLGMVKVNINPDSPWQKLISTDTDYPGMYNYFKGGNSLVREKLG